MDPVILLIVLAGILLLALTWLRPGNVAKWVFSLVGFLLILQGSLGALHAWGESQQIGWILGWVLVVILFCILIPLRWRRH
ncbi:MAG: hypothetical protein QGH51_05380 [Planctomycetota bacterium]|jgi:hypothetical protein|nr:hypothetical protein [Planctomycetota bacterium]